MSDTITIPRHIAEQALADAQMTVDSYSPDCGNPNCDDCEHVLRPAVTLRDALRAALGEQ